MFIIFITAVKIAAQLIYLITILSRIVLNLKEHIFLNAI